MTPDLMQKKLTALWNGWIAATGTSPPNPNAIKLVLAQALYETAAGEAWDISHNWGACDLRALNAQERAAFASGSLEIGMWLYPDSTYGLAHLPNSLGTVRGDSDPNTGAFKVWFAAFDDDAKGAAYMLRAGVRGARAALNDPSCTPETYAQALYVGSCYFGGTHAGARPCGHRQGELNPAEQANVNTYAAKLREQFAAIDAAMASWVAPGEHSALAGDTWVENTTPNAGDEILGVVEPGTRWIPTLGMRRNPDPEE